jgi:hypothetical protein
MEEYLCICIIVVAWCQSAADPFLCHTEQVLLFPLSRTGQRCFDHNLFKVIKKSVLHEKGPTTDYNC